MEGKGIDMFFIPTTFSESLFGAIAHSDLRPGPLIYVPADCVSQICMMPALPTLSPGLGDSDGGECD